MKKFNFIYSTFILCAFACLFMGYRSNPPTGYTGSTGTTCNSCHSGASYGGSFNITGVPTTILPNTAYVVTVTLNKTSGTSGRAGFELNVVNGVGTKMGTLSLPGTGVGVTTSGAHQYVRHNATTAFVNTGTGAKSWTFTWTSPATTTNNNITFYASGVIADGADDTDNDEVANTTFTGTFTPASTPLTVTEVLKTNVTCFGGNNGTATVAATGGSGCTNSFLWSNGQTGATATGLAAGSYTVTATCNSSTGTKTVTITQPASALAATATGSTLSCSNPNGGTASITASGGGGTYGYLWSNTQTGSSISGLSSGTYNVTITDNNGCTLVRSATVNPAVNTLSVGSSSTAETCITLGTATAIPANGTAPYSFLWSNGNTTAQTTGITGGTSPTVTVTDNVGCKSTASVPVPSNKTAPTSSISGNTVLTCALTSTTLSAPSGAYTYNWSDASSTQSINASNTGTYSVTVTNNSNGCSATSSANVTSNTTPPTVAISGNLTLSCSAPSTTLSTSGGSAYQWSGPGITSGTTSASINANIPGTYNVTVTSSTNGCKGSNSTNLSSNINAPITPNINPTNPTLSCSSPSVSLISSASSSFTHQWYLNNSFVGTGTQYNATQAGAYKLIITDTSNGCTSEATTNVTSTNVPLSVTAQGGKITCSNPTVQLNVTATGAVSYRWIASGFDSNLQSPSVSKSGTYTVIATASNGCTGSAQATVLSDTQKPAVSATTIGTLSCTTPSVTLNATSSTTGLTYAWLGNNGFSASGNPVLTQQAGIVTVTATNPTNGCSNTSSVTVTASNDKPIVATEGGAITCKDTIITIKAIVTGNTTGLTYKWSGPSSFTNTTTSANVKKSGDYVITVTASNGCSSVATAKVTLDNQAPSIEIISSKAFICDGDSIRLTAKSSSTISTYAWSDTSVKNETIATQSGNFSLTVSGTNDCKNNTSFALKVGEKPVISLLADSLTCKKNVVSINTTVTWATATTTAWTGANGFTSSALQPDVTQKGTYTLKVTPNDGCAAVAEIIIIENKIAPNVKITSDSSKICDGIIKLTANSSAANSSFVWSNGVSSSKTDISTSGKYITTNEASNGCIGKDSIAVNLPKPLAATIDVNFGKCGGLDSAWVANIGGVAPYKIADADGKTITKFNFLTTKFPLEIKDALGCKVSLSKPNIVIPPPAISYNATIVDETGKNKNGSIKLQITSANPNDLSYTWSNSESTKDLTGISAGNYCVTITDKNACSKVECFTVKSVVATEDNFLAKAVRVFPNPANDLLNISVSENTDIQYLILMNDKGQLISIYENIPSQLDISLLPQGIYFLKIGNNKGEWAMKRVSKL